MMPTIYQAYYRYVVHDVLPADAGANMLVRVFTYLVYNYGSYSVESKDLLRDVWQSLYNEVHERSTQEQLPL